MRKPPKPDHRTKKKRTSKNNAVQGHSGQCDVVSSLTNAPPRLVVGQVIRGAGEEAEKEICSLFNSRSTGPVAVSIGPLPKRMKVVSVQVYGTQIRALLDSGAIPNLMNASVASKLSVSPYPTSTNITVATGQTTTCLGFIEEVLLQFNGTVTSVSMFIRRRLN